MRRTKIVCTIGPQSCSPDALRGLVAAGMDVARLNFSHGMQEDHRAAFEAIREIAGEAGRNVAIMADLQGPKIRTGKLQDPAGVNLIEGASFCITTRDVPGDAACVSTTYANLPLDVKPGDRILLADGAMALRVERVEPPDAHCRVERGGRLGEHKGINLPGVAVSAPSLTEKDLADLAFAVKLGVDYVALSFVRSENDVLMVREHMGGTGSAPGVVAKIERPEALERFDAIAAVADAVMVARGDLGIEVDLDDLPQIQKDLIRKCNAQGIPAITATQMLESMMTNPAPTRAEVSDVANAIYDGSDAVMLSGETAAGRFPLEAARAMADIAAKADRALDAWSETAAFPRASEAWRGSHSGAIAEAVSRMTRTLPIARIVCFTKSGHTARAIARCRPTAPITAVTLTEATARRCALVWGVDVARSAEFHSIDDTVRAVDALMLGNRPAAERGLAQPGETILIVGGAPMAVGGITNFLKLHTVGESA